MSWLNRAENCISQGGLTNSKWPESLIKGLYPTHVKGGHGSYLYDCNDIKWADYICGLGSNLFGYGNDYISKEIMKHIFNGANHSLPTKFEVEAAEALKTVMPWVERFKFTKTGTAACDAAIRFARAATGRLMVLSQGYHGVGDEFVSLSPPAKGVHTCNDIGTLESLGQITKDVAAVIIEPVITDYSRARMDWLKALRDECTKAGALLIFDEVITGMRFKMGSVAAYSGVTPDLICLGKAVGGGLSLAAVGGSSKILDDKQVFISSTYAGETWPLIACAKAVELQRTRKEFSIDYLWDRGQEFMDDFNKLGGVQMVGYPSRGSFEGDMKERALFCQEMARHKILFHPSTWFYNYTHIPINQEVIHTIDLVKERIREKRCKLEYPLPATPFAAKLREKS